MRSIFNGLRGFFLCFLSVASSLAQDVDHLNMEVKLLDSIFHVTASYEMKAEKQLDSVYFILNPGVVLDTIQSKGLSSYRLTEKPGRPFPFWILNFTEPILANNIKHIVFNYKIDLRNLNHLRSNWIELNTDKLWFPNRNDINNPFTYNLLINRFPTDYKPITYSSSKLMRDGNTLRLEQNEHLYEVFLLAGKDLRTFKIDDKLTILGNKAISDSVIKSIGNKVRKSIDFLNQSIGMADPIDDFRVVLRNTPRTELGYQYNRNDIIVTGIDFNDYANLSHEIAHYWWNKANFIDEPWINESFANYCMYKVLDKFDPELLEKLLKKDKAIAAEAIPVNQATLFADNAYPSYYTKGAILLLDLETRIGEDKMFQLLSNLIEKQISTTSGFLEELEKLTSTETMESFRSSLAL